jgi:FKBP-type peptidyl-prolyl cis-trans isomerase (trigger factor)
MKRILFRSAVLFALVCTLICSVSCSTKSVAAAKLDFEEAEMSELCEYVLLGEYKEMTVKLDGRTKSEAVWSAIRESAAIVEYPAPLVKYYELQKKAEYEYYAEQLDMKYKDVLKKLGTSEDEIRAEAERMAVDDLLFELVKRTENISLSDNDKTEHFDRYVKKYVKDYGYDEEYVRKNLSSEVYDSMLYDKVCEFLIMNNDFN